MPALEPGSVQTGGERLDAVVRQVARVLEEVGIETAWLDARLLVAAATGLDSTDIVARPEALVAAEARQRLAGLVARRCQREPVSRILGEREFYGRAFTVTQATLDPRPDSETIIEEALAIVDEQGWRERPLRILDIGTGTGCLLVTLLAELPHAVGSGTDVSDAALAVATANAERHGVKERAMFACHDALDGVAGTFDLVVCNPPYIASADVADLEPEVRAHDPLGALDGGVDGLDIYRRIIPALPKVLPSGWVLLEVGAGQADSVASLLRAAVAEGQRSAVRLRQDLGGHNRCVAMGIQL